MKLNYNAIVKILFLFIFFIGQNAALASKLPNDVWNFVKTNLPDAQQRFDSIITLPDEVMYIPLYPPNNTTVDKISIEYTYPEKMNLAQLPEVVLLNNGYSLLKVIKDNKGNYTLTKKDDLPLKVRLGLMPQDMLTPVGLIMPESLKLTLGDLLIPSKDESSLVLKGEEKQKVKSPYNPTVRRDEFIAATDFKDKKIFINPRNSKFLEVYDSTSRTPLYELKLASMPLKILASKDNKVALVLYWSGKNVEIIDLKDERTIATIELEAKASDAVLNEKDNIAYIASSAANAIYILDMNSMQLKQAIKLNQKPSKIAYSSMDDSISFYDEFASKIFNVTKNGADYIVQPMGEVHNVSKIISDIANIYAISRTDSQLIIFDKALAKQLDVIDIDKKPTDALMYGTKIFILCSKEGYLDVYDTIEGKIISREQLSKEGFYSNLTLVQNQNKEDNKVKNNLLITGINSNNYLLYNLETMKLVKKQESYVDVANIVILDKVQRL